MFLKNLWQNMKIAVHCITWTYLAAVFQLCEKAASFCNRLVNEERKWLLSLALLLSPHSFNQLGPHIQSLQQAQSYYSYSFTLILTTLKVSSPKSFRLGRQVNLMVEWWLVGWTPTISHTHSMRFSWFLIHSIQWWDSLNPIPHMHSSNPPLSHAILC